MDESEKKLREFLSRFFRSYDLKSSEDIFATGYVNSMFAMQLVVFVEKEFGIRVEDEDLDIDNFRSINALLNFIEAKRGSLATAQSE